MCVHHGKGFRIVVAARALPTKIHLAHDISKRLILSRLVHVLGRPWRGQGHRHRVHGPHALLVLGQQVGVQLFLNG